MADHLIQFVALTFDDGSLGVMQFVLDPNVPSGVALPGYDPQTGRREATDAAIQAEVDRSLFEPRVVVSWRRVAAADVPLDRTYRNAWRDTGTVLDHDLAKARAIHRDYIREARAPLFASLDADYMQADEQANLLEKQRIAGLRQALRDAPQDPRIDAATTITELKAAWPAALGANPRG